MLPLFALALSASAQDAEPTEENATSTEETPADDGDFEEVVLVWPDKFARWRDTRWLVATEIVIPTGFVFAKSNNAAFGSFAFQVKGVITCDQDYKLGGKRIEVLCEIEDIAIKATSYRRFKRDRDKQLVQAVLDELDAKLTNAQVQLQVSDRGAVTNVDIEGVPRRNRREGLINETLRQIVARLMYPFHMKLPKAGVKEGNWPEFNSVLMSMPNSAGITGSSTVVHWMNFYKGFLLVQDIGTGMVEVTPLKFGELGESSQGEVDSTEADSSQAPTMFSGLGLDEESTALPILTYRLNMDGVSIYNVDNGIMEERVWTMTGTPTASNDTLLKYWYSGRIQMLGKSDEVDLGPSEQIAYPGIGIEGLPAWLPVDPEVSKGLEDFKPQYQMDMSDREDKKKKKKQK